MTDHLSNRNHTEFAVTYFAYDIAIVAFERLVSQLKLSVFFPVVSPGIRGMTGTRHRLPARSCLQTCG